MSRRRAEMLDQTLTNLRRTPNTDGPWSQPLSRAGEVWLKLQPGVPRKKTSPKGEKFS
jgi:hypothetical protein